MRTLLIPCMGRKLFLGLPQWISEFPTGETLLEEGLKKINLNIYDRIIVVIFKRDLTIHGSLEIIKRVRLRYPVLCFFYLDDLTNGPAETVYKVINQLKITGNLIVKDIDAVFNFDSSTFDNFIVGTNIVRYQSDIAHLLQKSFLILNEQKQILDVIEKRIKSEFISMGMYGFRDANLFKKAFEQLSDVSYPIKKVYISHIISYLIGRYGESFYYSELNKFYSFDSENDWIKMLKKYETYIIDLDKCELNIHRDLLVKKIKKMKAHKLNVILVASKKCFSNFDRDILDTFPIVYKNKVSPINLIDTYEKFNLILPEAD